MDVRPTVILIRTLMPAGSLLLCIMVLLKIIWFVKEDLIAKGHKFVSETDTEVVAHLMAAYYDGDFEETVKRVLRVIEGSYSLGVYV